MNLLDQYTMKLTGNVLIWGNRGEPGIKETYDTPENAEARKKDLYHAWTTNKLIAGPPSGLVSREFLKPKGE